MQSVSKLLSGELKGITSLSISEDLIAFPIEILDLADTLEFLDLSFNKLTELPADFGRLTKLKVFLCGGNLFKELPAVLGDCAALSVIGFKSNLIESINPKALNINLRWLILTNNKLQNLPVEIGNCKNLQKLMLAGNKLQKLPSALQSCLNLSLLRVSANRLNEIPAWLFEMPKLAWFAFSGNKFLKKAIPKRISLVNWNDLNFHQQLGEGASGTIYKAARNVDGVKHDVAVKIFKGSVTSDGFPEDEMNAYMFAGDHKGIVKLIGQIDSQENNKKGVMMELIPHHFYNLGNPPNFVTCVRDTFSKNTALTSTIILKIITTVASIASQLHERGIMHGDLYAHNILVDQEGNTLFGDFGAATIYDKQSHLMATALEKIEVLAFSYLLDDLLKVCIDQHTLITQLETIKNECSTPDLSTRPTFNHLFNRLDQLRNVD